MLEAVEERTDWALLESGMDSYDYVDIGKNLPKSMCDSGTAVSI